MISERRSGKGFTPAVVDAQAIVLKMKAKRDEWKRREREEYERRRAEFTGDCVACFDEGECQECERGRAQTAQRQRWEAEREAGAIQDRYAEMVALAKFPPRLAAATFASYPDQERPALAEVRRFVAEWDGKTGLILSGPVGTGKTGLLVAAMREAALKFAEHGGGSMLFVTSTDLLDGLKNGFDDATFEQRFDRLRTIPLLAIDDLGAEKPTDWVQERIFSIVNYRYERFLPIWLTTNFSGKQIADKLGERTLDRLLDMSRVVKVTGASLRRKGLL